MERQPAQSFEELVVWQKSHALVLEIYRLSANFPKSELYGLTSQVRRSAVSIAANSAEGFKKRSQADKARFMNIAQGSLEETLTISFLPGILGMQIGKSLLSRADEVGRLLGAYSRTILSRA